MMVQRLLILLVNKIIINCTLEHNEGKYPATVGAIWGETIASNSNYHGIL
jgi:hypothetical protein